MRLAIIIICLAATAVALVQVRRAETAARHQIQTIQRREVSLRRRLWDQQVRLGRLAAPQQIRRRVTGMVADPESRRRLAETAAPRSDDAR